MDAGDRAPGDRAARARGTELLDVGAVWPAATLRRAGTLGDAGAYDAVVEGGAGGAGEERELRARGGGVAAGGQVGAARRVARAAGGGGRRGGRRGARGVAERSRRRRVGARADRASVRKGVSGQGFPKFVGANDPWVHRVEPSVEAALLTAHGDDLLGVLPGRGTAVVHGDAWVADVALASEQGRWGARIGSEISLAAGVVGALDQGSPASLVTRGHAAPSARPQPRSRRRGRASGARATTAEGAFTARARVGELGGLHVVLLAAERDGIDPVAARALTDAPLEPSAGFLASTGWTAGARARIPWTAWLATTGGADFDLTAQVLVAARGGIEVRDHCGCLRVRANAAHRIGRDGVDAWVTIDLAARARATFGLAA